MEKILFVLFGLANIGLVYWVGRLSSQMAKYKLLERQKDEKIKRMNLMIENVERIQTESRGKVERFIKTINNAEFRDDFDKLLDEAFGSLVREDPRSK